MKKNWLLFFILFLSSCMSVEQKIIDKKGSLLLSSNYGGWEKKGYTIITQQEDLDKIIENSNENTNENPDHSMDQNILIPKQSKVLFYNFGQFNSGNHQPKILSNIQLKDQKLLIDVVFFKVSKHQTSMIANPWMLVVIPEKYEFNNVVIHPISKP